MEKQDHKDLLPVIREMERAGVYYFPFELPSGCGDAILDPLIDCAAFMADERNHFAQECRGECYKYTEQELRSLYGMVEFQRVRLARALVCWKQILHRATDEAL